MNKIAIFDIDGTIVSVNTTEDFINFYLKKYNKVKYCIFLIYRLFIKDILIILKQDIRKINISFLKGAKKKILEQASREYIFYIRDLIPPYFQELIQKYRKEGYILIFLSASLDIIVQALIRECKFNLGKGCTLKFDDNDISLGELEEDIRGKKHLILSGLLQTIDYSNSIVFSDNKEDLQLLQLFPNSIAIINNRINYSFWCENNIKNLWLPPYRPFKKYYLRYCLPLGYFFYSRAKTYFIIYFIMNSAIIIHLLNLWYFKLLSWHSIILYIISLLIFYSIYEIHYLLNDCHAFQEINPALNIDEITCKNKSSIIFVKFFIFIFLSVILIYFFKINILIFLISYLLLNLIFYLHTYSIKVIKPLTRLLLSLSHLLLPLLFFPLPRFLIILSYLIYGANKDLQMHYFYKTALKYPDPIKRIIYIEIPLYSIFIIIYLLSLFYKSYIFGYLLLVGVYYLIEEMAFIMKFIHFSLFRKLRHAV